jgi:hypothetical protein
MMPLETALHQVHNQPMAALLQVAVFLLVLPVLYCSSIVFSMLHTQVGLSLYKSNGSIASLFLTVVY